MLTRWTPLAELAGLHRDLDSLFGRVFGEGTGNAVDSFTPAANVHRDGGNWLVSMSIPGVPPEKVDINVTGRTLRVRGERTLDHVATRGEAISNEISYGRFEREFTLPEDIDVDHVHAAYRHGILALTLPLKESARPRRIEVQTTPEKKQLQAA